jgi:SAM-dependent methyltransferase
MSPSVLRHRRQLVDAARRRPLAGRTDRLRELAAGRRVLDVGVVDHDLDSGRASESWLHGQLAAVAGEILGVDVVPDQVARLQAAGYRVECRDITRGDLPEGTFDLVVAGEVLEHLPAPGGLFDAACALLAPGGRFVLSTPNPYAVWRVWQHLRGRVHENVDHVLFSTPDGVAELAARSGLRLDRFAGIHAPLPGLKAAVVQRLVLSSRGRLVPEAACESVLYEFVLDAD